MRHFFLLFVCVAFCIVGCKPSTPDARATSGLSAARKEPTAQEIADSLGLVSWELSVPVAFGPKVEVQFGSYDSEGKCLGLGKITGTGGGTVVFRPLEGDKYVIALAGSSVRSDRKNFKDGIKGGSACLVTDRTPIASGNEILLFREVTRYEAYPKLSPTSMSNVEGIFVIRVCPAGTPDDSPLVREIIAGKRSI